MEVFTINMSTSMGLQFITGIDPEGNQTHITRSYPVVSEPDLIKLYTCGLAIASLSKHGLRYVTLRTTDEVTE